MFKKSLMSSACLALLLGLTAGPSSQAHAQPQPSIELLLPYFEVQLQGSDESTDKSTVFIVTNTSEKQIAVVLNVWSNWGVRIFGTRVTLKRYEERVFDLFHWIGMGKLPDGQMGPEKLQHVQAALSGKPSPKDQKYYSTEVAENTAAGYVTIRVARGNHQVLCGDCFIITPPQQFGEGEMLVNADGDDLCRRHAVFLLLDGRFVSETKVVVWNGKQGDSSDGDRPRHRLNKLEVYGYTKQGVRKKLAKLNDVISTRMFTLAELGWNEEIRWLELITDTETFVAAHYFNEASQFSAALRTCCLPWLDGDELSGIDVEKSTNGEDADAPPGPTIPVGDPVKWKYVVTNTGDVRLNNVQVKDDQGVRVRCPKNALAVGESMTCTARGTAKQGQYKNVATATGKPPSGPKVEDTDPSHYHGPGDAEIDVEKSTNGEDADAPPGPTIPVGDPVKWKYVVTNTGDVRLTNVQVKDDQEGRVPCPKTALAVDESMTCTARGTAREGQYKNVATATGKPPSGPKVKHTDPSHYLGKPVQEKQGCTPGYWKNHTGSWPPTGYSPGQKAETVFSEAAAFPSLASKSLLETLQGGGGPGAEGGARILLRAAVAAVLNASHPGVNYQFAANQVTSRVNSALASGDRAAMISQGEVLDRANNAGCPLN